MRAQVAALSGPIAAASRRSLARKSRLPIRRNWCCAAIVLLISLSVATRTGARGPTPRTVGAAP
eukprot:2335020-Alexandrium_andersonii.AAC.1